MEVEDQVVVELVHTLQLVLVLDLPDLLELLEEMLSV